MTSNARSTNDVPDYSLWGDEFNMEAFRADPARWNKDWEKAIRTRPAADVFTCMGRLHRKGKGGEKIIPMLTRQMISIQEALVKLWESVDKLGGHFITAWVLLDEKERTRHLNKGFEDSYSRVSGRQDARCYAPEITISALLKRNGKAFLELIEVCVNGKKEVGAEKPYFHPSKWWDKALEGVPESFLEGLDEHAFEALTLYRNDFITKYLLYAGLSVFHDLSKGSAGMKPVTDFMTTDPLIAEGLAKAASSVRDEPIVRCQNCTKTQGEDGPKYMLCSGCKTKLNFTIHYCSVECQRGDWRNHKKHCGKEKIAKKLAGTIHDPYWSQAAMPDELRHIPVGSRGTVEMSSLGFGDAARASSYSTELQRQVNLLTADREADYFLFDEMDRPIRFVINDQMVKMGFRVLRTEVLSSESPKGVETMVEYIIKIMGRKPGLNRQRIIAQFAKEYRRDVAGKLTTLESHSPPGLTTLESMTQGMSTLMSRG